MQKHIHLKPVPIYYNVADRLIPSTAQRHAEQGNWPLKIAYECYASV